MIESQKKRVENVMGQINMKIATVSETAQNNQLPNVQVSGMSVSWKAYTDSHDVRPSFPPPPESVGIILRVTFVFKLLIASLPVSQASCFIFLSYVCLFVTQGKIMYLLGQEQVTATKTYLKTLQITPYLPDLQEAFPPTK